MIKKLFSIMLVACALYSCTESIQSIEDESPAVADNLKEVTLNVGFEITTAPMKAPVTRAQSAAQAVTRIVVSIFDSKGDVAYETSQTASDTDFGTIKAKLQPGNYKVVVVGTKPKTVGIFSPLIYGTEDVTIYGNAILPTYSTVYDLTVTANNIQSFKVEVPPVVTVLEMISTDACPSNISSLRVTISPEKDSQENYTLNPGTGFVENSGAIIAETLKSDIGSNGMFCQNRLYLQSDETTKDILVEMLDADSKVVRTREFKDIEFTLGKTTRIKGAFFSTETTGNLTFGDWSSDVNLVEF